MAGKWGRRIISDENHDTFCDFTTCFSKNTFIIAFLMIVSWHKYFILIAIMRQPRYLVQNAEYHVTARANRQEFIFEPREIKLLFIEIIKKAKTKYNFRFRNFDIMDNHVHLILQPLKDESLSKIMQWILSVFAVRFNKKYGYKGHVFYDRFKSKVIESFSQFLATFLYVANNPVRARIVDHPLDHEFNGVTFYKKKCGEGLLDPPDQSFMKIIDEYLEHYDVIRGREVDKELTFRDRKPGRPRKDEK